MNRYKFIDEGRQHLHTLDGNPLIGASTVSKIISSGNQLQWWASGRAVETLGWIKKEYAPDDKYKKKCINENERLKNVAIQHENICGMGDTEYLALLDTAYKAHSVRLKESAEKGIDLHLILQKFLEAEIRRYKEEGE